MRSSFPVRVLAAAWLCAFAIDVSAQGGRKTGNHGRSTGRNRSAGLAQLARAGAKRHLARDGPDRPLGSRGGRATCCGATRDWAASPRPSSCAASSTRSSAPSPARRAKAKRSSASTRPPARTSGKTSSTSFSPTCPPNASAGVAASATRRPAASTPWASAATCSVSTARRARRIWTHSLNEEFGLLTTYGGRTNVPVVFEDLVIISGVIIGWGDLARPAHRFLAFDKKTGAAGLVQRHAAAARGHDLQHAGPDGARRARRRWSSARATAPCGPCSRAPASRSGPFACRSAG